MKNTIIIWNARLKGFVLLMRPHTFLGWLRHPFLSISNILGMTKWISQQDKKDIMNDFFTYKRNTAKRYEMYAYVVDKYNLKNEAFDYLEFGVCGGNSFKWWMDNCVNENAKFYGFDTFEGLPEAWGTFNKGDMAANMPVLEDKRGEFVKGLFQQSVPGFLEKAKLNNGKKKIIHLDADLFTSTLFALTSMAPYLKKGDILFFDEFNVPNHEYYAFKLFCESYYVKTKLIAAINNYYQVAIIIE